jgi:hypothetical protein
MSYLHTHELHISLISYRVRGEIRHNLSNALVRIHKYLSHPVF